MNIKYRMLKGFELHNSKFPVQYSIFNIQKKSSSTSGYMDIYYITVLKNMIKSLRLPVHKNREHHVIPPTGRADRCKRVKHIFDSCLRIKFQYRISAVART